MKIFLITCVTLFVFAGEYDHAMNMVAECYVEFRVSNAGLDVTGYFDDVDVEINFNENKLHESHIVATAKAESIHTGIPLRDKHLKRSDYFYTDIFPEITLTSVSFRKTGRNKFTSAFKVQIKKTTKVITIPFSMERKGEATMFTGRFEINRLDFGLGEQSLILDENVHVTVVLSVREKY